MNKYFKVEVKYSKPVEGSDEDQDVVELYVFKAVNYTDAETQATEKFKEICKDNSEFIITKIEKIKINKIIEDLDHNQVTDKFYLVKTYYDIEERKKVKTYNEVLLIKAKHVSQAAQYATDDYEFTSTIDDIKVKSVVETAILEVFDYEKQ